MKRVALIAADLPNFCHSNVSDSIQPGWGLEGPVSEIMNDEEAVHDRSQETRIRVYRFITIV